MRAGCNGTFPTSVGLGLGETNLHPCDGSTGPTLPGGGDETGAFGTAMFVTGSYCRGMTAAPTVLVSSRQSFLAFPELCGVCCALGVASVLIRGIPDDTSTRVVTALFAAGAVGCLAWVLLW